VILGMS
jgi:hypothetical protein